MEPKGWEMLGVQAQVTLTTGPVRVYSALPLCVRIVCEYRLYLHQPDMNLRNSRKHVYTHTCIFTHVKI